MVGSGRVGVESEERDERNREVRERSERGWERRGGGVERG